VAHAHDGECYVPVASASGPERITLDRPFPVEICPTELVKAELVKAELVKAELVKDRLVRGAASVARSAVER
jgi:hypothetical protein